MQLELKKCVICDTPEYVVNKMFLEAPVETHTKTHLITQTKFKITYVCIVKSELNYVKTVETYHMSSIIYIFLYSY